MGAGWLPMAVTRLGRDWAGRQRQNTTTAFLSEAWLTSKMRRPSLLTARQDACVRNKHSMGVSESSTGQDALDFAVLASIISISPFRQLLSLLTCAVCYARRCSQAHNNKVRLAL